MGSSSQLPQTGAKPCPLKALGPGSGTFNATCEVTNKINIDKFFELMKEEYHDDKPKKQSQKSPLHKSLSRSVSSGSIEPLKNPSSVLNANDIVPLSPRRKKNMKKRISCDDKSLAIYAARNNIKHSDAYFNYDLSGHIIDSCEDKDGENHHLSRQKSWDLSISKVKNPDSSDEDDDCFVDDNNSDFSASYSAGDFKDLLNNNQVVKVSKSCNSVSDLGERHMHHAMVHGRIGSVSQQNRRHRRRLYKKKRKSSDEKVETRVADINGLMKEKLCI